MEEEIGMIHELKDIREELRIILRILETQRDVAKQFVELSWFGADVAAMYEAFLKRSSIGSIIDRTKELDRQAERTLQDVSPPPIFL